MFDFLSKFFGKQKSGEVAKERLQLVLIHDRNDIAPEVLEKIKVEIIATLKRYLEIDENEIDMHLDRQSRSVALVANIPLKHIKRGAKEASPPQERKAAALQKTTVSAKTASGAKESAGHAPKSKASRGQKKKNA